jgi:hypothetical protein
MALFSDLVGVDITFLMASFLCLFSVNRKPDRSAALGCELENQPETNLNVPRRADCVCDGSHTRLADRRGR